MLLNKSYIGKYIIETADGYWNSDDEMVYETVASASFYDNYEQAMSDANWFERKYWGKFIVTEITSDMVEQ